MSSVPLRPRVTLFSYDSETGSRRPRWFTVLAGLLALLIAAAGILVGVSAASAHNLSASADCYKVSVSLTNYDTRGPNTVKVTIDGVVVADVANFGANYVTSFPIPDPTKGTQWKVEVTAWDDNDNNPNAGYGRVFQGTSSKCAPPAIDLKATECNSVNGTTDLTATFTSLLGGVTYLAQLYKNDVPVGPTFTPSTAAPTTWAALEAGVTYKLTVWSTDPTGLSKTVETHVVACPQNSELQVTVVECTAPGGAPNSAVQVVASALVPGRQYTAQVFINGTAFGGAVAIVPGGATSVTTTIPVPPSTTGMKIVLTDVDAVPTVSKESAVFSTMACPTQPDVPTVVPNECTTVGGATELTVSLGNLTPGRGYVVLLNNTPTHEFVATSSTQGGIVLPVPPGDYVVTIVDKALPNITASTGTVTLVACPTQPKVDLAITECSVPGGKGTINATFSGLSAGRSYTITITQGAGQSVPGYAPVTVTTASGPIPAFSNLEPGITYTVTIVDTALPDIKDADSALLQPCPFTPKISLTLRCLLVEGDSLVTATINDLENGAQYLVEVSGPAGGAGGAAAGGLRAPVATTTITGGATPSTATFQLPNNVNYTFTVTKIGNPGIVGTASIFAAICDLPTFDLPTLALTGAGDTTMPMLGALGLVQFGVALLALAAMLQFAPRRRTA